MCVQVLWAQFLPDGAGFTAATGGVKHVRFWNVGPSGLTSKKGLFGAKGAQQPLLCATCVGGKLVTGTVSGELYIWEGNTVGRVRLHPVCAPQAPRLAALAHSPFEFNDHVVLRVFTAI